MEQQQPPPTEPAVPPWLTIARREIGVKERAGKDDHPRIVEYLRTVIRLDNVHDEIPWCSAFANWCMAQAKVDGTGSAAARSWLRWGASLKEPKPGCVVVCWRGSPADHVHGHVGFFDHLDLKRRLIYLLGGNQGNQVGVAPRPLEQVLGYRWPLPQRVVMR